MVTVLGEILPFATAVAVSPLPVIVVVFILVSDHARAKGLSYLLGRALALTLVVTIVATLVGRHMSGPVAKAHPTTTASIIRICIGVGLVVLAAWYWHTRPKPGEVPKPGKLLQHVDRVTPVRAFVLGVLLAVLDIGTLLLSVMAGLNIGEAKLPIDESVAAAAVFIVLALVSSILPVAGYLIGGAKLDRQLSGLKVWLLANEKVVMMVLFLILGALLIGRGVSDIARID